jgi:hypothetical protein
MAKPFIHARSSAKKYGGIEEDYIDIHNWMDSSKSFISDNRHRALWHSSAGIFYMERIFGVHFDGIKKIKEKYNLPDSFDDDILQLLKDNRERGTCMKNSDGKMVSVRDIAEQHVLEDYGMKFIPTAQDYIENMEFQDWMNNGRSGCPNSYKRIESNKKVTVLKLD